MPRAFSADLIWRMVWSYSYRQLSMTEIAENFFVPPKNVRICIDLFLNTRDVTQDGRKRGYLPKLQEQQQLMLLQIVFDFLGIYLEEIQVKLEAMGIIVSLSQICAKIHDMGLTKQKMHFIV